MTLAITGLELFAVQAGGFQVILQQGANAPVTFDFATFTDRGDYVDPVRGLSVTCHEVTNPTLRDVFVRRADWSGAPFTRKVVEVYFGLALDASPPSALAPYTVTIVEGGVTTGTLATTVNHGNFCRWRAASNNGGPWTGGLRPIYSGNPASDIAALQAKKWLPLYDINGLGAGTLPVSEAAYTILGFGPLDKTETDTGERGDIGPFASWDADLIGWGRNWQGASDACEAMNSFPVYWIDGNTGALLDPIAYPHASYYNDPSSSPKLIKDVELGHPDEGHEPNTAALLFMLQGDPWDLMSVQAWVAEDLFQNPWSSRYVGNGRYEAWSMRGRALALTLTPASAPSWLWPKSTLQTIWNNSVAAAHTVMASGSAAVVNLNIFNASPPPVLVDPWQSDFVNWSFSYAVALGFTEVRDIAVKLLQNLTARIAAAPGSPSFYEMDASPIGANSVAIAATDTTMTMARTYTLNGPGWSFPITVAPETYFPAVPFAATLGVQGEVVTVTAVNATTGVWTITRGAHPGAHPVGTEVLGPTEPGWAALYALLAKIGFVPAANAAGPNLYVPTADSLTYFSYILSAAGQALQAGITDADVPGLQEAYNFMYAQFVAIAAAKGWKIARKHMLLA